MADKPPIDPLLDSFDNVPDALIRLLGEQTKTIESLKARLDAQQKQIDQLTGQLDKTQKQLEEAQRSGHRQAAPFRIDEKKRKDQPKSPGRKKGHRGCYRSRPDTIDETIRADLERCSNCGGPVHGVEALEQFIEEIPPIRPRVIRLVTHQACCARCGTVRSPHPLQVSTATGAAGVQPGPNALGVALDLNKRHGLTKRKTCRVLRELFGLRLSPGGLVAAAHRMAARLGDRYDRLVDQAREASVIHADETSWWVGAPGWQLWVFANNNLTLYRVRDSRGRKVIHETLGKAFGGVLVSDCLSSYDDASPIQHKCYAHHLKAISKAIALHADGGQGFLLQVKALLKTAQIFKNLMAELLVPTRGDPLEEAVANRLRRQRDHLFTFLDYEQVDSTNNLAERQLRPAVIARKVSCGNRTERGARTWEVLTSLATTTIQRGESFRELISQAARLDSPLQAR
jgi:transposase